MMPVKPFYLPALPQEPAESGYIILRDGTTAAIRLARPEDSDALQAFVDSLPPEARRHRFFPEPSPPRAFIRSLCDPSDPRSRLTLVVTRLREGRLRIIAAGSYVATRDDQAEVGLAVDEAFHGKGLGAILLERLALLAIRHGFVRLWAVTRPENVAMREVLRESGFELKETQGDGDRTVELSVVPTAASVSRAEIRDRIATAASLRPFFQPRSVAVVGASRDSTKIGHRLFKALRINQFPGPIYPVNPKDGVIGGLQAYASLRDVPGPIDLAIIAVPRDAVLHTVEDCAARAVRALIVITAGFAEVGEEGRALQARLVETVRHHGMRMIGPNCMGLLNTDPDVRLNATFSPLLPGAGGVAMSSQSGALGLAILAATRRFHLGISSFVSVGNKADVSGNDLLQYWEEDSRTSVILLYLESFGNPRRFARLARRVSRRKPIVAVKAGRTPAGRRAATSHTAALASSDVAVEALFHQTGVIRADTLEEMFALAAALESQPLPPGRRVAIVSNAGGPAILCADACEAGGLVIPTLSEQTRARLATILPETASLLNPVDLIATAGPDEYRRTIELLLAGDETDALLVLYVPVDLSDPQGIGEAIRDGIQAGRAAGGAGKPVLVCRMGEEATIAPLTLEGEGETIPSYAFPETAARVLSKAAAYAEWRRQPVGMIPDFADMDLSAARKICTAVLESGGAGWLSAEETRTVLTDMRLPILPGGTAGTPEEAAALARRIGFPVAVKLASRSIVHKTEVEGVRLNLGSEHAVRRAFTEIRERLAKERALDAMDGVLVQPMLPGGVELMVGVAQDPLFGPVIAFGLGGIHVEILKDVCFRITPLTDRDAAEMVRGIKGVRLLEGYRGHPPADIQAVEEVLLRVSRLVEEIPEISELDLNPVFALPPGQGCRIVDARIRVEALRRTAR